MSNPGLLVLAEIRDVSMNIRRLIVEDNIGEAIHIHWNNLRFDLSIIEFLRFADQFATIFKSLSSYDYPDFTKLDPEILILLGKQLDSVTRIDQTRMSLKSLKRLDNTHPATKLGRQVVVFGDEPYIRFGADNLSHLANDDSIEEIDVTVIFFKGTEWRHVIPLNESLKGEKNSFSHKDSSQTVLILAGMPGTGKSTILRNSITHNNPIFGTKYDAVFQTTRLPSRFPEDQLILEDRLKQNTWIHELDLIRLHVAGENKRNLVVHFDLFWFLASANIWDKRIPNIADENDYCEFLLDIHRISKVFQIIFSLKSVKDSRCCIKVLKPVYLVSCNQWNLRQKNLIPQSNTSPNHFLSHHIYCNTKKGRLMYDNIYEGWQSAIDANNKT